MKKIVLVLLTLLAFVSCKKKDVISQATADDNTIKKYLSDNNLTATRTGSGLYYIVSTQGTGNNPVSTSNVTVVYKGYLVSGSVFDQSKSTGFNTALNQVIDGWQEGLQYFKKGGKGKLFIPSALGYGAKATGNIPANSVLIFDVELLDVQ
jgi:FKBP-type peptidyl-prolyl cis-trans isomerase FkpA